MMQYYEYLSEFIPFTAVLAVLCTIYRRKNIRVSTKHIALAFVFAVYIVGVFYFTEAGTLYDALQCTFSSRALNLSPFSKRIDTTAYLLNIVMFIPLGIMVPFIWKKAARFRYILLYGFAFSLLIELSQLLNPRSTDIDDVILNTSGAVIGYLIFKKLDKYFKFNEESVCYNEYEPGIYIIAMFAGRFFLFNELGAARIMYGI